MSESGLNYLQHTSPYFSFWPSQFSKISDCNIIVKSTFFATHSHFRKEKMKFKNINSILPSMKIPRSNFGFTLFELMLAVSIFGMLMIFVLNAVWNITIARTRSMSRITLLEELYFFSEKLATQIKEWGIVDYEEYWSREVMWTWTATGHYITPTGFGNYGSGWIIGTTTYWRSQYYCRSGNGIRIGSSSGCVTANVNSANTLQRQVLQRYWQYGLQFIDYNGNADSDWWVPWDEDGNGNIRGDEDDKDNGDSPIVLSGSSPELYLINSLTKERLYFRWTYKDDPGLPAWTCSYTGVNAGSGCLWNIEILKLRWLDIGIGHSWSINVNNTWAFDGEIDTWVCHPDWTCAWPVLPSWYGTLPTGNDSEWVSLFPEYVNVKKIYFSIYPRKDPWKSWAAPDSFAGNAISPFIHPYVRVQMTMWLAWEKRKLINNDDPIVSISTTISLSNSITE